MYEKAYTGLIVGVSAAANTIQHKIVRDVTANYILHKTELGVPPKCLGQYLKQ